MCLFFCPKRKGNILKKEKFNIDYTREDVKEEVKHLEKVVNKINSNLVSLQDRRNEVTRIITEYRKTLIEENKYDPDISIFSPDHEMSSREAEFLAIDKRVNELFELVQSPYFGKINFNEDGLEEEIYVGKYGFFDEKSYEPLVIDWRAPISSLFYHGGLGEAEFNTPDGKVSVDITGRRQFMIKDSKLEGMFDSEVEVRDEILQYVLASNTVHKLKDIIMTIQREQDEIIRYDRNGTVIVNGVAGSGKTTIALHRIAYLLYNNRKKLQDKVLILGPNNIFMDYISQVLPTLGEESIRQNTLYDFVEEIMEFEGNTFDQEDFIQAVLSGDEELRLDANYKRSMEYLSHLEDYAKEVENELYTSKDIIFNDKVLVSKEEMKQMMSKDFAYMPIMKRALRVKRVIISRLKEERNLLVRQINEKYKNLKRDVIDSNIVLDKSKSRREEIRDVLLKVFEVRDEIRYLGTVDVLSLYIKQNTQRFLTKYDLIPLLYLTNRLKGIKLPYEIKYLVIDEAQDYSKANLLVLKHVTKCNDFTIVGDSNQRILVDENKGFIDLEGNSEVPTNLKHLDSFSKVKIFNLTKSYRSTDEIVKYASKFADNTNLLESLRDGEDVKTMSVKTFENAADKIVEEYERLREMGMETIAIITRNFDDSEFLNKFLKGRIPYAFLKSEDAYYNESTLLLSSYLAKGLEFDAVILVDTHEDKSPDLIKYIMITRALHALTDIKITQN